MLELLKEAVGQYTAAAGDTQIVSLSNGITARLVIAGGRVITFFPLDGPGIVYAKALMAAVK